jgi:hypothetical protein
LEADASAGSDRMNKFDIPKQQSAPSLEKMPLGLRLDKRNGSAFLSLNL